MHKKACLTAGFFFVGLGSSSSAYAETLAEALVSAYTTNPTLEAQRARLRAADEQVPQALSNWRPTVKLSGDAGRSNSFFNQTPFTSYGTTISSPNDVSIQITQPIYRGGRTVAQTKQAEATVQAERALLEVTEQSVLQNVITAYMNVVQNKAVLELSINNEQVLQRQLDATNDRFRVGEVTRTDVAQAESRLSAAHADRTQAEGNLRTAVANYITNVGHAPINLVAPGPVAGLPGSLEEASQTALLNNPNILNAQYTYDASSYGIDLIAGELLPSVTFTGTASKNYDAYGPESYQRVYLATVNLTVPLYQQGQEYSRLRAQKHTAGQYRIDVDVARRDIVESVTVAWQALQTARARIASYTDQIKAAEVALEGVQRESQVGSRTVLDVLNAEQELLNARVNLVQAQHDETVAEYQVKGTLGQLTAKTLALPVEIYDPTKHYEEVRESWIGSSISPHYGEAGK